MTITQEMLISIEANTYALVQGLDTAIAHFDKLDKGMKKVGDSTSFLNRTLSVFSGIELAKLKERLVGVVNKVKELGGRFVDFAQSSTLAAARIEVQWRTLSMTAAKMGVTFDEVKESIGGLRGAGIKTSEALQVMTQWLSAGLPSEKLSELSRAAQDLAVVLGSDSTQAMERFNWFVQTGNSELLRTVGIMQTSTQMEERFAASIGKTREQLSDQERRLARVNGLLEATATYAGAYEEAMKDPFKRLTSLPRLISNVVEVIGAVFVPLLGTAVDIASDALEKIERLFRVTKKEAKETGATIGEWKEGFLRLRAVVQAFANWFMDIWERLTEGFNERTESMMDRFVNAIIKGVKAAANALAKFAQFLAKLLGGTAPRAVSETVETVSEMAETATTTAVTTTQAEATETYVAPKERAKLLEKAVEAVTPEWYIQQQQEQIENMMEALQAAGFELVEAQKIVNEFFKKALPDIQKYWELTEKLNQAIQAVVKAKNALARAEERLEKASEKVYDIRRKIAKLELQWAEIPERFIRGRKRQLQLELQAAEHEEHERQKEVEAARERLQEAEEYRREIEQMHKELGQQIRQMAEEIANQNKKYQEWLDKLEEASEIRIDEPVQAVANEFESLDDLTAQYLDEIEGQLKPAFASIEESVKSIAGNLGMVWEKVKGIASDVWSFLTDTKDWFDNLPDWAKTLLKGAAIAITFNAVTGGLVTKLTGALAKVGFTMGPAGWLVASLSILATLILTNKEELAKWFDPKKKVAESWSAQGILVALQKAVEWSPMNWLSGGAWSDWWDQNVVYPLTEHILNSESNVEAAVSDGVEKPMIETMERASREIVGTSIVPEMVESILDWFDTLQLDLTPILDQLTGKLKILEDAFKGLIPTMKEFGFASGGSFKVTIVNLQNSTFGDGLTEWQVQDWIYKAMQNVVE